MYILTLEGREDQGEDGARGGGAADRDQRQGQGRCGRLQAGRGRD